MEKQNIIQPQEGYQFEALSSSADIVIGGGGAGVGKTYCLLLDLLRYVDNKKFRTVIFRRTSPQITNAGGLWDESSQLYNIVGAKPNKTTLTWTFPKGSKVKFSHLEYEKNIYDWQGSQIDFIGFDELTHFTQKMFFYLLSRNRSVSGVKPCIRATCNPDPDSWVAELIDWWIGEDGFPIPERSGVIRWFVKDGDSFIWGSSKEEVIAKADYFINPLIESAPETKAEDYVKSITFIGGSVYQNKKLLEVNPTYLANLAAQDDDSKNQLLYGNWKTKINPSDVYDYEAFKDMFTNDYVGRNGDKVEGESRITVDVAMQGDDKLIICYFKGRRLEDLKMMDKSNGKEVITAIKAMQLQYKVSNSRVVYDANGVGAFIGGDSGFISGAKAFDNNSKMIQVKNELRKFKNLKAQCYYLSGDKVNEGEYYISERVAAKMYNNKETIKQRFLAERKAIKKAKRTNEEPYDLIKKSEMKQKYLSGASPDLMDSFMMNEYFYIVPKKSAPKATVR